MIYEPSGASGAFCLMCEMKRGEKMDGVVRESGGGGGGVN